MPRNSAGTYTLPAGNPVVAGTTIDASWANDTMSDMANEITNSLSRTGAGGMLAPFRVADGSVTAPGLGFTNETNTGLYRAGTGELWFTVGGVAVAQITANGLLIPSGKRISLPAPVNDADAANKEYVDDLVNPVIQYANYYLGPKSSDPSVNNSGGPLTEGTTYWSTTLDQLRVYNGTTWEPMPSTASVQGQTFSGTGAQTAFTLAAPTGNATNLEVFISGVRQVPTTDYTVSGTTLTFTSAPPSGTDNIYVRFAQLIALASADSSNISFLPAGTGAVTRTAQSKMRETISLADFGAVGDGVADDTLAIQTAINALGALGQGRLIGTSGASYKITDTIDFTVLGNTHNWYEIDFAGAEFTWYGSQVGADPMFYFYGNKAVKVQNFTLIANPVASISATVKGIRIDSLQPDGADLLVLADFKVRLANLAIDLGSVGVDQNRVSDCRFEHFLIETCSVGIQTNSTNCDSLTFTNGQLSGCTFGFNFVRAGFNKIDTCIGYECDSFIRIAGPIGPLTVINSQSEPQTLPAGNFLYRKIYTLARNSPINLIGCNTNEKIWLDYDAGIGSDIQTLNIAGGYFSDLAVDAPDSRINLIGTTQYTGTTFTLAGTNSRCYSVGSELGGTLTDAANGYIAVGTSVKYPVTTGGLALAPAFSAYKNANQSIAAYTPTVIAFQVEEFDTGSYYDNATNYWFAPKVAGYYQVNWGVLLNDLLNSYYSELYKNGVSYKAGSNAQPPFPNPGTTNQLTGSALVYLNGTTDYIQVLVTSTGSGQVNGNAQSSFFQAVMVRGA